MKTLYFKLITAILIANILTTNSYAGLSEFLEKNDFPGKLKSELANLDINFSTSIADIDLAQGLNLSAKYKYNVEASYQDQYYTRIDKYDVKANINVGDVIPNFIESPFSLTINRENSFYFVRQFKTKKLAITALPYTPKRLPITADIALNSLEPGDFVSIPASLNIAVGASTSTTYVSPVVLNANIGVFWIISGEFIIQIFKIDDTHVRLKMISKRSFDHGISGGAGLSFNILGVSIVDHQIDRIFDRDLIKVGHVINPGAQFIVDYVFNLADKDAKDAYNQILKTTLKFKDLAVINQLTNASALKDKIISSFEKAEKLFEIDKLKKPEDRRISRIFKGFNNYSGTTKKIKLSFLLTSYVKDTAYTENKINFTDKNENNIEFLYPTYTKYIETKFGKWIFDLKDQSLQTNFGLIPKINSEESKNKNPDFGLNFERRDKSLSAIEQRAVQQFMVGQIPRKLGGMVDLSEWKSGVNKQDTKINFQLILKAQGFNYIKGITEKDLTTQLMAYVLEKKKLYVLDNSDTAWKKLNDFLFIGQFIKDGLVKELGKELYNILKNSENDTELMLIRLVKLNSNNIFDKIGVGFLISLLPEEKLEELVYFKLEMTAKNLKALTFESGQLSYQRLYKELGEIQTRIGNRSYDLRLTKEDQEMENNITENIEIASENNL